MSFSSILKGFSYSLQYHLNKWTTQHCFTWECCKLIFKLLVSTHCVASSGLPSLVSYYSRSSPGLHIRTTIYNFPLISVNLLNAAFCFYSVIYCYKLFTVIIYCLTPSVVQTLEFLHSFFDVLI